MAAMRAYFSVQPPEGWTTRCSAVGAPVLVLAGTDDPPVGRTPPAVVAGLFPQGAVTWIEGCGHFPWVEQPAAFRAAVDPFLAS